SFWEEMITRAPCSAKTRAIDSPRPWAEPRISAIRPD
ncbi:uncharacterized protein METZ01_LOCUS517130, partial [marine metagenome]